VIRVILELKLPRHKRLCCNLYSLWLSRMVCLQPCTDTQFFPRESGRNGQTLACHFLPPSGRLRTGGRCPEWARGKMCGCLYWITNWEGKQLGYKDQEKGPLVRGAYRSKNPGCCKQRWLMYQTDPHSFPRFLSTKAYKGARRPVCSKLHTSRAIGINRLNDVLNSLKAENPAHCSSVGAAFHPALRSGR
jgi:hypothetical protein